MAQDLTLITGASGEIGHALIALLSQRGERIVAADVRAIKEEQAASCELTLHGEHGDVTSPHFIEAVEALPIGRIYHLAAVLSTAAERDPIRAHRINVDGTLNIIALAQKLGIRRRKPILVLFPSTIAVYGFPTLDEKHRTGKVREDQALSPVTIYGITKLHCERVGEYYSCYYGRVTNEQRWVDFRALRYPGLISADTLPTGGTSDYAPEMLHAAAQQKHYRCFVRPDTQLPFMAMPDAIKALVQLADAPAEHLTRRIYNVGAFAPTAEHFAQIIKRYFPNAIIEFEVESGRQAIVDSWCADVDDSAARDDWGWQPTYDFEHAFSEYLVPAVRRQYAHVLTTRAV